MKKIFILILAIAPIFTFSQGAQQLDINWISLEKAKMYAKKYDKNILIYFYKKDCPYCDKMSKETLKDLNIINVINKNFFPVKIDSRTKDIISYDGKKYSNQQPISHGSTWRHDFYAEVAEYRERITTPTIVLFNSKFEISTVLAGNQPKELLLRRIKPYIK